MSYRCEHGKDSDICAQCWEERNLESRIMNEPTELQKAIEEVERLKLTHPNSWGVYLGQFYCDELLTAAKQLEAAHTSFDERGASLVKLQGMLEALQKENEALTRSIQDWQSIAETNKLALESMTKERDELQKAYLTVKGWAHRLEYKLIALMEKCEEAAAEEPAGSFADNLVGMMNELDVNNCHTANLLADLESSREENTKMREALSEMAYGSHAFNSRLIARNALSITTTDNCKEGK